MSEYVNPDYILETPPSELPRLVSFWEFKKSSDRFVSRMGEPYTLYSRVGYLEVKSDEKAPFSGSYLDLEEGQWLSIPRHECPALDIHGKDGQLTVAAWIRRRKKSNNQCEFIAGQWNESNKGRQYGLFLNISVWQQHDQICGHLSHVGGPTPGYKYCIDGPVGSTKIDRENWHCIAMSYDGYNGYVWLDGQLDSRSGLNPYSLAGGLHDGGPEGSDFTLGAVDRSGEIGNFFTGYIGGLAVYNRALSPAEIFALSRI